MTPRAAPPTVGPCQRCATRCGPSRSELARLLADTGPAEAAAARLAGRPVLLIGIGSSWHAAHHGAWLLRDAGVDAVAAHAADLAPYERPIDAGAASSC